VECISDRYAHQQQPDVMTAAAAVIPLKLLQQLCICYAWPPPATASQRQTLLQQTDRTAAAAAAIICWHSEHDKR
jgi:hypothetical protein